MTAPRPPRAIIRFSSPTSAIGAHGSNQWRFTAAEIYVHILVDIDEVEPTWGPWGPWGACSQPCDGDGLQARTRNCTGTIVSSSIDEEVKFENGLCGEERSQDKDCTMSLACVDGMHTYMP